MSKIPESDHSIEALVYRAYEQVQEAPRPHMGCSQLGEPCERKLWLSFRWSMQEKFSGRMLKLFARGHREEALVVADLRRIGAHVEKTGEQQSRVSFGSHVSGSVDGVVSNLPHAPKTKAVLECKTHSEKSFQELKKNGVENSKPLHFIQCQTYMLGLKLDRALYYAVNKNTDEVYTEWIHFDEEVAIKAIERGQRIALAERMPEPISADPATWYQCKFCDASQFCAYTKTTQHVNCRTCALSTPQADSTWHCAKWDAVIPVESQRTGCEGHVLHPDLVPWQRRDGPDEFTAVYEINGVNVANGDPENEGVFSSRELLANATACADKGWAQLHDLRKQYNGRIVG